MDISPQDPPPSSQSASETNIYINSESFVDSSDIIQAAYELASVMRD
jgi:hypothetical protein